MKKVRRYGIGAILLAGVGIGIYLNDMLPQLGSGVGIGAQTNPNVGSSPTTDDQPKDSEQDVESQLARPEVVEVLIDSRQYLVKLRSNGNVSYQVVALERLLEFAKMVPGTEDGIKVIIARKENSRATAEMNLRDKLLESGINDMAILWQRDFVE